MATQELLKRGNEAFVDEEYSTALDLYSKAISKDSKDAALFAARAAAQLKLGNNMEALEDAGKAVELQPGLAKAHLRKGTALFNLEEYESAKDAFEAGLQLDPQSSAFKTWVRKCDAEMEDEALAGGHTPTQVHTQVLSSSQGPVAGAARQEGPLPGRGQVLIEEIPDEKARGPLQKAPDAASSTARSPAAVSAPVPTTSSKETTKDDDTMPLAPSAPALQVGKYRHQWFQINDIVEVNVLAKGMAKENVSVQISEQQLRVVLLGPTGEEEFDLDVQLWDKVVPAESKYAVLKTKVEVKLKKANSLFWKGLEKADRTGPAPAVVDQPKPSYPSSKKNTVDWTKLIMERLAALRTGKAFRDKLDMELKKEEKDEKLDGDAALNKLFKDIYGNADEDTRRAMNKSFQESNGTVLSTNWKDIGKKKTEWQPPSGADAKKFEQ